jgi:hypothetical protein
MGSRNRTVTNSIQNYIAQQQLLLLVSCSERGKKRKKKKVKVTVTVNHIFPWKERVLLYNYTHKKTPRTGP